MSKRCIHMFISWLGFILRKATFWSYKIFLAILRLFRRCYQVAVSGGRESRRLRDYGSIPSSQPSSNQDRLPTSATLAGPEVQSGCPQLGIHAQLPTSEVVDGRSTVIPEALGKHPDIILKPIIPAEIKRYDRKIRVKDKFMVFKITKGFSNYEEEPSSPWQALTHPEGALFFFHPEKRVFTDADVRNAETAVKVDWATEKVHQEARRSGVILPSFVELGLEFIGKAGHSETWGYYFADCASHSIAWFEDNECKDLMSHVRGVERLSHVRYAIESQYWQHIELFPNKRVLIHDDLMRLKGIVMHALADDITSDTCLAPFSPEAIANTLSLMKPLSSSIDHEHEHSVCIVARFMRLFCHSKFVNFCGQTGARLDTDQPLYGDPNVHLKYMIFRVMNILLFGSPVTYSTALHKIWVDETIIRPLWKNFIDKLKSEWNEYAIFSTVILAVNIALLAVPSIDVTGSEDTSQANSMVVISYISTLCAMGSLGVSLILAGQVHDAQ